MVNYSCEKCGKEFSQKGHYTKHLNKKNPCVVESKVKEMIDKVVEEKLNKEEQNLEDLVANNTLLDEEKNHKYINQDNINLEINEENYKLINGDCLIEMKNIKDKSIDMILCDLPYGMTKILGM